MLTASALMWTQIAAAVCVVLTLLLLWGLVRTRSKLVAARSWPTAPGEIIASSVERPPQHEADSSDCTVKIRYRYKVAGKLLEGDGVRAGGQAMAALIEAEGLVARYPLGAAVDIAYDPNEPTVALLEPADQATTVAQTVFVIVFAVISAVLITHAIAGKVPTSAGGLPLFAYILPLAAIAVGIGGVVSFIGLKRRAAASASWPAAPGQITQSTVVTEEVREKHEGRSDTFTTKYRPDIRYRYRIGGRDYFSNAVISGWASMYGNPDSAEAVTAQYPTGAGVEVFYDPAQPRNALLEPHNKQGSLAPLIFGLIFGAGGAFMLWIFSVIG